MSSAKPMTILCLASYFKGEALLTACKAAGCHVILVTNEKLREKPWPWDMIDEAFYMPDVHEQPAITNAISYLARTRPIRQIIALDDFDVEVAAALREHMRLHGIGQSLVRYFRDKLAMRMQARASGILVPDFCPVLHHHTLYEFMMSTQGPWLLKPRSEASAMGIKLINHPDELWPHLESLGDEQSYFLLECYIPGDVFHVDGLVYDGEVVFASAHKYGRPPMNVYQGGGVFITRTMDHKSEETQAMLALNAKLLKGLGMPRGATHTEYIKAHKDGRVYFLETAARVGGANIAECVQHATNINLWAEWGRIEVAYLRGEAYQLPSVKEAYAGVINCLAKQEWPDTSAYDDPEIVWRMNKKYHAGFIVASPDATRLQTLLDNYAERFVHDFLAVLPPLQSESEMVDE